jgi:glycosyltransferase involved in cell wall biosynthesis
MNRRLLIVTSIHPDFDKRVWRHAASMARSGWRVDLVCPWDIADGTLIDGVKLHTFRPCLLRTTRPVTVPIRVGKKLWPLLKCADIVHFHDIDLLPWMSMLALKKPIVYDVHENYPDEMLVRYWIPRYLRKILFYIVKYGQRAFARIIKNIVLVAPSQREDFNEKKLNVIEVRNYALAKLADEVPNNYVNRKNTIIFIGNHYPENGSWLLLDIIRLVIMREPDVKFLVAARFSSSKMREKWIYRVENESLSEHIEMLSDVPSYKINKLIDQALIGINPVLRVQKQIKAINTKLFEFMARGVPFVSSDLPFPSELVQNTGAGLLAQPEYPESFAQAILRLCRDKEFAAVIGSRGRRAFLEKYTWENQARHLAGFYQNLLK